MEVTFVDAKKLKTLEDYAISLVSGMLSIKTLEEFHARAIEIGILTEDLNCRGNTIVWDMRRMLKLYQDQLESILEILPDDFNADKIIEILKKQHLTKARSITRKPRVKKCDT